MFDTFHLQHKFAKIALFVKFPPSVKRHKPKTVDLFTSILIAVLQT